MKSGPEQSVDIKSLDELILIHKKYVFVVTYVHMQTPHGSVVTVLIEPKNGLAIAGEARNIVPHTWQLQKSFWFS